MQEPKDGHLNDQEGYDTPNSPYTESDNPYTSAIPEMSQETPPVASEQVVPEPAASVPPLTLPEASPTDPSLATAPVSTGDPNAPYQAPLPGTEAAPGSPTQPLSVSKHRPAFWFSMGSLVTLLLVGILSTSTYFLYSYINRSTPVKTLDAFCEALQREEYENAYDHFSRHFQNMLTEADFETLLSQDKIVGCTHGSADDSKSVASTNLKLVHNSQGVNNDIVTLTKDGNNTWKINDLRDATG